VVVHNLSQKEGPTLAQYRAHEEDRKHPAAEVHKAGHNPGISAGLNFLPLGRDAIIPCSSCAALPLQAFCPGPGDCRLAAPGPLSAVRTTCNGPSRLGRWSDSSLPARTCWQSLHRWRRVLGSNLQIISSVVFSRGAHRLWAAYMADKLAPWLATCEICFGLHTRWIQLIIRWRPRLKFGILFASP